MRSFLLIFAAITLIGCVGSPPAQDDGQWRSPWRGGDGDIVVFTDDSKANALLRQSYLAEELKSYTRERLDEVGMDSADGADVTRGLFSDRGRRSSQEIIDSLPMLEGYRYALSQSYSISTEKSSNYKKVWFSVDATLYDVRKQKALKQWQLKAEKHLVVPKSCDQDCVEERIVPRAEQLSAEVVASVTKVITGQNKKRPDPDNPELGKPNPITDDGEQPDRGDGDWKAIDF